MKIIFECLGFATNPCFILDTEDDSARPLPYGAVLDNNKLEYWIENYMPSIVSEAEVLAEYKRQLEECGVCINDVSKEAWLDERFGEKKS